MQERYLLKCDDNLLIKNSILSIAKAFNGLSTNCIDSDTININAVDYHSYVIINAVKISLYSFRKLALTMVPVSGVGISSAPNYHSPHPSQWMFQ